MVLEGFGQCLGGLKVVQWRKTMIFRAIEIESERGPDVGTDMIYLGSMTDECDTVWGKEVRRFL